MTTYNKYISGKTIFLREVSVLDVNENYYNWMNDPEINQYLETRYFPRSRTNIAEFVKSMDGNNAEILFAICDIHTDSHIGNIKIGPINWIHGFADISLLIGDKDYWGKGIATEAIQLVSQFAFGTLNLHKLKAGAYGQNLGSIRAFLKVGFRQEGLLKKQWKIRGEYQDEVLLGLTYDEFNLLYNSN